MGASTPERVGINKATTAMRAMKAQKIQNETMPKPVTLRMKNMTEANIQTMKGPELAQQLDHDIITMIEAISLAKLHQNSAAFAIVEAAKKALRMSACMADKTHNVKGLLNWSFSASKARVPPRDAD